MTKNQSMTIEAILIGISYLLAVLAGVMLEVNSFAFGLLLLNSTLCYVIAGQLELRRVRGRCETEEGETT